jgi:perosamine synthetase
VLRVLRSGQLVLSSEATALESEFSERLGALDCIAVSNGSVALTLALAPAGVGLGDEVVTTAFSFLGTIEPIIQLGARTRFVDVEPDSANLDVHKLSRCLTDCTVAIVPVHLYGRPVGLVALREIAAERQIPLIKDACQAIGASMSGVGAIGASGTSTFSFYGGKNITSGEGGLVATHDAELGQRVGQLRDHGGIQVYKHTTVGYNGRMTGIQAALLRVQLARLDLVTNGRQANAACYDSHIVNPVVHLPPPNDDVFQHCYHQYTVRADSPMDRDDLQPWRTNHTVESRVHYPYALSSHPVVDRLGYAEACPCANLLVSTLCPCQSANPCPTTIGRESSRSSRSGHRLREHLSSSRTIARPTTPTMPRAASRRGEDPP